MTSSGARERPGCVYLSCYRYFLMWLLLQLWNLLWTAAYFAGDYCIDVQHQRDLSCATFSRPFRVCRRLPLKAAWTIRYPRMEGEYVVFLSCKIQIVNTTRQTRSALARSRRPNFWSNSSIHIAKVWWYAVGSSRPWRLFAKDNSHNSLHINRYPFESTGVSGRVDSEKILTMLTPANQLEVRNAKCSSIKL